MPITCEMTINSIVLLTKYRLVPYSMITSQVVSWRSFGTCQLRVLTFCLMLVYWRMLLCIQVVMMEVLEVLY